MQPRIDLVSLRTSCSVQNAKQKIREELPTWFGTCVIRLLLRLSTSNSLAFSSSSGIYGKTIENKL